LRPDWLFFISAGLTLGLDAWTKALVQSHFMLNESLPLIPGVALTYVRNPGAAFSLLAGAPAEVRLPFFVAVTLAAGIAVFWMLKGTPKADRLSRLGLGLVLGGAIGNALDRLRFMEVVDFIEVGVRGVYTWPVFNVADSAVCVGVGFLIWRAFFPLKPKG
jgi:signal peptidase II